MNWDAIGAIGEIVGAMAVVATLVYLATQIRHSYRATRASTYQEIYRDYVRGARELPTAQMFKLIRGETLSDEDQLALAVARGTQFHSYENIWMQHKYGVLDSDVFEDYMKQLKVIIGSLGQEDTINWWRTTPFIFNSGFSDVVEQIIREIQDTN